MPPSVFSKGHLIELLIRLFLGAIFIIVGVGVAWQLPRFIYRGANRVEVLVSITATNLEDTPVGGEVLVEGRISQRNPIQARGFVAYIAEGREVDEDGDEHWWELDRVTPPLLLELPDGVVQIENSTYGFRDIKPTVQSGDVRYEGFAIGDPVIAVGVLAWRTEPPQVTAEFIAPGTQASYVASQRNSVLLVRVVGVVFVVLGVGDVVRGLVGAWRSRPR